MNNLAYHPECRRTMWRSGPESSAQTLPGVTLHLGPHCNGAVLRVCASPLWSGGGACRNAGVDHLPKLPVSSQHRSDSFVSCALRMDHEVCRCKVPHSHSTLGKIMSMTTLAEILPSCGYITCAMLSRRDRTNMKMNGLLQDHCCRSVREAGHSAHAGRLGLNFGGVVFEY